MTYVTIPISSNYPILFIIEPIIENFHHIVKDFVLVKDFRLKVIIFYQQCFNLFIEVNYIVFRRHLKFIRFVATFIVSVLPIIVNFVVNRFVASK